ncbi:MAG: porin [Holosporales bacterium]|jgi:hypothetical protein|nr:porin [Holosporales bacterium]
MRKILLRAAIGAISLFPLGSVIAQDADAADVEEVNDEEAGEEDEDSSGGEEALKFSTKISGELQTFSAAGKQDLSFGKDHGYFATSGNILFNPTVVVGACTIGGNIGFGADASSGQQCATGISESFLSFSGWFGEFQFGNQCSAADEMSIDGTAVLGGQEGAAGAISSLFNVSGGVLLQTGASGDDGIATKLIYLSPVWSLKKCGTLQVAISYTPNSQLVGMLQNITHINYLYHGATYNQKGNLLYDIDASGMRAEIGESHSKKNPANLPDQNTDLSSGAFFVDGVTGAIVYNYGSDEAFNFAFAVCGWYGKGKAQIPTLRVRDLTAYQVGSTIGYKQWKLALGFTDNLKSLMNKTCNDSNGIKDGANMGKVFTVGLAWEHGPWKASAGYFHSVKKYAEKDDQAKAQVATLALDYKFMEGVSVFGEFDWIKTIGRSTGEKRSWVQATSAFADNKGWLLFAGAKINF